MANRFKYINIYNIMKQIKECFKTDASKTY